MKANKVKIVTDSSAYLDTETAARYDIRVVPLRIAFGAQVYRECLDISNQEFYQRVAKSTKLPTTSQPPAADFSQVYGELVEGGHPILSIHFSSKLSGTFSSALLAKQEYPEAQIEVLDTLSTAVKMFVLPAARAAEQGDSLLKIRASIEKLRECMNVVAMLDTLEYLWKGGRIGRARALLGALLNIKPLVEVKHGEIYPLARPRTRARAIRYMLDFMEKRVGESPSIHIGIIHTHAPELASAFREQAQARFNPVELEFYELGPVLTTHLGPEALGLSFYTEEEWRE